MQHAQLSLLTLCSVPTADREGGHGPTFPVGREQFLTTRGTLGELHFPQHALLEPPNSPRAPPLLSAIPRNNSNGDPCDVLAESSLCLTTLILMATHFTDVKTEAQGGEAMPPRS